MNIFIDRAFHTGNTAQVHQRLVASFDFPGGRPFVVFEGSGIWISLDYMTGTLIRIYRGRLGALTRVYVFGWPLHRRIERGENFELLYFQGKNGAAGATRTPDLVLRRHALYPAELQPRISFISRATVLIPFAAAVLGWPRGALRANRASSGHPSPLPGGERSALSKSNRVVLESARNCFTT